MDCRALKRLTCVTSSVAVMAFTVAAYAQNAPEDHTPPPVPGPTEQPPAESLPPCPAPEQAVVPAPPPPETPPPIVYHEPEHRHNRVFAPSEMSIMTGAGASNYFGSEQGTNLDPGAAWDARVTFGTHSVIALEAGYLGGVNNIDMGGGAAHGQLFSNGVDGDLRLQLPTRVQPYVFGGVGYNHMEVRSPDATGVASNFAGTDDQVTVPAGGGLNVFVTRHIDLDARGTYRFIPDNGITTMGTNHLHQWIAQAHVGYVF